jgi:hypothetical protein
VGVEAAGVALWCEEEAGPYQTVPYPGESWEPEGHPARQPHEYERNGTAKRLTLFRPATGVVRAKGVTQAPNAVRHPWLKTEREHVLDTLPAVTIPEAERPPLARWETWLGGYSYGPRPPLRLILVWDNLAGHLTPELVRWRFARGVLQLYTPLSGSWLNMAESVQRILVRRALAGQHPQTPTQIMAWLEETVDGWNQHPTPFVWGGKRQARRQRARLRRLGGSGAALPNGASIPA